MTEGFWKTLQDNTFAMWFGWSVIAAIVVFPLADTIQSCWSNQKQENIETAKLRAQSTGQQKSGVEHIKWLVAHGVHPLVARCAVLNDPAYHCSQLILKLDDDERATVKELLDNPRVPLNSFIDEKTGTVVAPPTSPPKDPSEYVAGLDFGLTSPTQ